MSTDASDKFKSWTIPSYVMTQLYDNYELGNRFAAVEARLNELTAKIDRMSDMIEHMLSLPLDTDS